MQFTDTTISSITQHCVEVHAVISQYILDNMDINEVLSLFPLINTHAVSTGILLTFRQSYGVHDPLSLTVIDYLRYQLSKIENVQLADYLKTMHYNTITEPFGLIQACQMIDDVLKTSPYTINLSSLIAEEINSLKADCKQILKDAHKLCRRLNQIVQRNLYEKNYDILIQTLEKFIKDYPLCNVAQKAVTMVKKIIPYCDGEVLHDMMIWHERLFVKTPDYHAFTTLTLPGIKICIKLHKEITSSLLNGSPDAELIYTYIMSGKYDEEIALVKTYRLIKLQEAVPNYAYFLQAAQQ